MTLTVTSKTELNKQFLRKLREIIRKSQPNFFEHYVEIIAAQVKDDTRNSRNTGEFTRKTKYWIS